MQESTVTGYKLKVAGWGAVVPLLMLAILTGCSPKEADTTANADSGSTQPTEAAVAADDSDLLLRVRFAGTTALMADTNAAYLTDIAALPETAVLGKRLVERFASLPERLVQRGTRSAERGTERQPTPGPSLGGEPSTNSYQPSTNPLEPMFADLLRDGFVLELRGDSNGVSHMVLGTKTDTEQATRWNLALAAAAKNWFGEAVGEGKASWSVGQGRMQVRGRDGELTLWLSSGTNFQPSAFNLQPKSSSASTLLEVEMGSALLPGSIQRSIYGAFKRLAFTTVPTDRGFKIRGTANYTKNLPILQGTPVVPANLVTESTISFTVVREPGAWLPPEHPILRFLPTPVPDMAFFWGGATSPYQFFMAVPFEGTNRFLDEFCPALLPALNQLAKKTDSGSARLDTNGMTVKWETVPFVTPQLRLLQSGASHYLLAETFPSSLSSLGVTTALSNRITKGTNTVIFDWEFTQARVDSWLRVGQLALFLSGNKQLTGETASQRWLLAIQLALTGGGNTTTEISQTGPRELTLDRLAPLGFSSIELFWLANWLESPNFPRANFLTPMPQPDWGTGGQSEPTTTTPQGE
jgi:hypothetical protein